MINSLSITALVENTSSHSCITAEWGLSLWVEAEDLRILFDTGQGISLRNNANTLGVDLSTAHALVISHGHYDHIGGVAQAIAAGFTGKIYLHPAALEPKYKQNATPPARPLGPPLAAAQALRARGNNITFTSSPTVLAPGILITGPVPRNNPHEETPRDFFLDEACTTLDPLVDDQALLIETPRGWVLLTGCGHSGIMNLLHAVPNLTGGGKLFAVIGGFHLLEASDQRLQATALALLSSGAELIAPCHCTDSTAVACLKNALGSRIKPLQAGTTLYISSF